MKSEINLSDKTTFVLTFLSLILALSPLKSELDKLSINIIGIEFTFSLFLIIMACMLFSSIYLYAIYYAKSGYTYILSWRIFNFFRTLGDIIYGLTLLFPLIAFLVVLLVKFFQNIGVSDNEVITIIIATAASLIAFVLSVYSAINNNKLRSEKFIESSDQKEKEAIFEAQEAYQKKLFNYSLIELTRAIFNSLYKRLAIKVSLSDKKLEDKAILDLALREKIINLEQFNIIRELSNLRNTLSYGKLSRNIDQETAREFLDKVIQIINEISLK